MSALRAAARTKPVVVLRGGRSKERDAVGLSADSRCGVRRGDEARGHGARDDVHAAFRGRADTRDGHGFRTATASPSSPTGAVRARSPPTPLRPRRSAGRARRGNGGGAGEDIARSHAAVESRQRARRRVAGAPCRGGCDDVARSQRRCGARAARRPAAVGRDGRGTCSRRRGAGRVETRAGGMARRDRTAATSAMRCTPAAFRISIRPRMPSRRSRFLPPIVAIRHGCSKCRRRSPSRGHRMVTAERIRAAAASANRTLLTDLQTQQLLSVFDLPVHARGYGRHAERGTCGGAQAGLSGHAEARCAGASCQVAAAARAHEPARRTNAHARIRRNAGRRAAGASAARTFMPASSSARKCGSPRRTMWRSACTPTPHSGR